MIIIPTLLLPVIADFSNRYGILFSPQCKAFPSSVGAHKIQNISALYKPLNLNSINRGSSATSKLVFIESSYDARNQPKHE
jgi:hypothetical protein